MKSVSKRFWVGLLLFLISCSLGGKAFAQSAAEPQTSNAQSERAGSTKASAAEAGEQEPGDDVYRHSASVKTLARWLHLDIETAARVFEYLNFAILAGAVLFGLLRILPKTFRENRETIQKRLVEARTATADANERLAAVEVRLGRLDEEIAAIRTLAEKDGAEDEVRIKASIEVERQRILKSVGQEIAAATSAAQRDLKQFAAGLAIDRAAQKLKLTPDDDRALLQEFAQSLGQKAPGRGDHN